MCGVTRESGYATILTDTICKVDQDKSNKANSLMSFSVGLSQC